MKLPSSPLLAALAWLPQADVTLFLGPPSGTGDVIIVSETGATAPVQPPALQGIELLPIDFVGRTPFTSLLPDASRLQEDVPGASRVELPSERGSLYRYRRELSGGGFVFGFFRVGPAGSATSLWERQGTGPLGQDDPVVGRLSIHPQGTRALFTTSLAAGGNLMELDFMGAQAIDRTPQLGPQDFLADGLCLLRNWGVALTQTGALRYRIGSGNVATAVTFTGGAPAYKSSEIVCSRDGSTAAFVAGTAPDQAFVYVVRSGGPSRKATFTPQALNGGGFLPAHDSGPLLALSIDGRRVAFQSNIGTNNREVFVRQVDAASTLPEVHVTSDANFEDTLDDSGVIAFFNADSLVMMAGERDGPNGGVEKADFFRIDALPNGTVRTTNLTRTSGGLTPPYDYGELKTEDGVWALPGPGLAMMQRDTDTTPSKLLHLDLPTGNLRTLLEDVDEIAKSGGSGDRGYLLLERDLPGNPLSLFEFGFGGTVTERVTPIPMTGTFQRTAVGPFGQFAGVLLSTGTQFLGRYDPQKVDADLLTPHPLQYGPTLGFTASQSLATTVLVPGSGDALFLSWSPTGHLRSLYPIQRQGFILPGS